MLLMLLALLALFLSSYTLCALLPGPTKIPLILTEGKVLIYVRSYVHAKASDASESRYLVLLGPAIILEMN